MMHRAPATNAAGANQTPQLRFDRITHRYPHVLSVENISFEVARGEFVALVGPSGSGKSTIIKMAAGLEQPTSGDIYLNGERVKKRLGRTAYMPQSDALLPWRTVIDNVILGAEVHGQRRRESREQARELLARFGLEGFEDVYPAALSGGMRQRAAFLRTFMMDCPLVLLDEPLGALDAITRAEIQDWLLDVWQHFNYTILLVTHDVQEAVYLADRVFVLSHRPGKLEAAVNIELPRPRERTSEAFIRQTAEIATLLG